MGKRLHITARLLPDGTPFNLIGRDAWALAELVRSGDGGCTPIDHPGPRWSGYVHKLRHTYGISVETVTESHHGQFAGTHARYILRSAVEILHRSDVDEMAVAA